MKKLYDAVVSTGKYTDQSGKEKNRYLTVGAVMQNDEGRMSLKLEAVPVNFNGWINFYEPRQEKKSKQAERSANDEPNDEIPF